ncbi:PH domain-containing protein [Cellulosimicrobium sp. Marseille-Q8652]
MAKHDDLRDDIAAAASKLASTVGSGRELKKLESHLWDGERVELLLSGTYGNATGLLTLTDRRLLFTKDGIMSSTNEDFPIEKISSIQWKSGVMLGSVTVYVSNNKAEIKNVDKTFGKLLVDTVRDRIQGGAATVPPSAPTTPSTGGDDVMDQLRKVKELHEAGILTDAEFEAKKTELLGRI